VNIAFKINGRKFSVDSGLFSCGSFQINSKIRSYKVSFRSGIFAGLDNAPAVIDKTVHKLHYGGTAAKGVLKIPATEKFKTIEGVVKIWDFIMDNPPPKEDGLTVIGGGITQDVSGFACASFARGIKWKFVPTTLLSMCDSCIGAKTGINYGDAKNKLGFFYAPDEVFIHAEYLRTLDSFHIISGLGEILKLSVIAGDAALCEYEKRLPGARRCGLEDLRALIRMSLLIKKSVIEIDETDVGYRKALNYGHTLGHAVEVLSNYKIPHGQAVIIGLIVVNEMAEGLKIMDPQQRRRVEGFCFELLGRVKMPKVSKSALGELIRKDKKSAGGRVSLIVPSKPGETEMASVEITDELLSRLCGILNGRFAV